MTNKERKEISKDILENMDLDKDQYKEFCKLADELDLERIQGQYLE